jgi:hypothetical protein
MSWQRINILRYAECYILFIAMLNVIMLSVTFYLLSAVMLSFATNFGYGACHYAVCCYAERCCAECCYAEFCHDERLLVEFAGKLTETDRQGDVDEVVASCFAVHGVLVAPIWC